MATNKDQIISNFIAIAQCSKGQAREYLESANWNEQAAIDFFFDSNQAQFAQPTASPAPKSSVVTPKHNIPKQTASGVDYAYDSDDDLLQHAVEASLKIETPKQPPAVIPSRPNGYKSIVSSKVNTFNHDEDSPDEDGQAFYSGGSEQSGQQILGPPKSKDNDKKVTQVFDAARKQGARETPDKASGSSSSQTRDEKPFTGTGYSLASDNSTSRTQEQSSSRASAAAPPKVEQIPLRFYSNGFTVGDGELRKFKDNEEFMNYIKRGEVPPELRSLNAGGRQVEISLEDHRGEEYKRVTPALKPFAGTGYTLGLPSSGQAPLRSGASTSSEAVDTKRLEQLAEKRLKTSSSSTAIRLRLPDVSVPVRIQIDLSRTLADVRRFLNENVSSLQSNAFEFMEPPSTKIKRDDERRKICDTNLSNSTLVIRHVA